MLGEQIDNVLGMKPVSVLQDLPVFMKTKKPQWELHCGFFV
jgi:hypothetical protein